MNTLIRKHFSLPVLEPVRVKSTISAYLAVTSAGIRDNKALLIDCDIRRPTVHTRFGLSLGVGVANYLAGDVEYEELAQDSDFNNLKVITAGRSQKTPSELFPTVHLNVLFQKVRQDFNIIIIDTPPVIPVSDLLFLSNEADGILFVVKSGVTQKRVAKRAFELLEDWQEKILAVVVNNERGVLPYYYDYRYYNYKYNNNNHK